MDGVSGADESERGGQPPHVRACEDEVADQEGEGDFAELLLIGLGDGYVHPCLSTRPGLVHNSAPAGLLDCRSRSALLVGSGVFVFVN